MRNFFRSSGFIRSFFICQPFLTLVHLVPGRWISPPNHWLLGNSLSKEYGISFRKSLTKRFRPDFWQNTFETLADDHFFYLPLKCSVNHSKNFYGAILVIMQPENVPCSVEQRFTFGKLRFKRRRRLLFPNRRRASGRGLATTRRSGRGRSTVAAGSSEREVGSSLGDPPDVSANSRASVDRLPRDSHHPPDSLTLCPSPNAV